MEFTIYFDSFFLNMLASKLNPENIFIFQLKVLGAKGAPLQIGL